MKRNLDGSILIWSIFLVISISFSFLYISNGISKNIDKNKEKISDIQGNSMLDNFNFDSKSTSLLNNETLEVKYFGNFSTILTEKEILDITFLTSNTGSITIDSGGPIFYKVYTGSTVYSSGLVIDSKYDITLNTALNLSLENLGGLAKLDIDFASHTGVTYPYNYLTIKKSIGGNDIIKNIIEIK